MHPGVPDTHFKASITLLRAPDKCHPRLQGEGLENYRLVRLISVSVKILEEIFMEASSMHKKMTSNKQN